ncbi:MAG: hypothetical protein WCK41_03110 [Actinomycetes bacterium]
MNTSAPTTSTSLRTASTSATSNRWRRPDARDGKSRHILRRPVLPSSRAIFGGLLVATSIVLVFSLASGATRGPRNHLVVTTRPLAVGHRIELGDVRDAVVDVPDELANRVFVDPASLVGAVTVAPFASDEIVSRSAVVDHRETIGSYEFSFPVERERAVNGHLQPGEFIDIISTEGTGSTAETKFIAQHVRLLDTEEAGKATIGSTGKVVVTVAFEQNGDVVATAHASQIAAITLVRSASESAGDSSVGAPGDGSQTASTPETVEEAQP